MTKSSRGASVGNGQSAGNGNFHAHGNALPAFMRLNREYLRAWQAQYSFWPEQA